MSKETITSTLAREYRKKFPKSPTLTLARKLFNDNKEVYNSVEHARKSLRQIEGKNGKQSMKTLADKSMVVPERPKNPYNLPDSDKHEIKPYTVPDKCQNILLLSDLHFPYQDNDAITLALDYGKENGIDTILLNGDCIDFYGLSRFERDPRKRSVSYELDCVRSFLKTLRGSFPYAHIAYKSGNHDNRLERYLLVRAPELLGISEFELKNLLNLRDLNIDWVDDKVIMKLKSLNILHGHEYTMGSGSPVNVARSLFMKANAIAIQGHNHKTSENTVTTLDGDMITTWSTGCLCELQPAYLPYNSWNLGFAHIVVDGDTFQVFNKRIKGGKIF